MRPFFDVAIAPLLDAVGARQVIEIGAWHGATTSRLVEHLGADCELHVIDPDAEFDPDRFRRRFAGRYVHHAGVSLEVLPTLPPADVVLIDGDHNWYTVRNELGILAETARRAGTPLPLLLLHDVLWPYGRRDLYYEPERIPPQHRHPYTQLGLQPGIDAPVALGGLSPGLAKATAAGGSRNGVLTALEDFTRAHPRPLRQVMLPVYFGLAIVAEDQRLAAHRTLASLLDRLEGPATQQELVVLAESLRVQALIGAQEVLHGSLDRTERSARRYLDLLKSTLLNEHYLENEARLAYLAECVDRDRPPELRVLLDPGRQMPEYMGKLRNGRVHRPGKNASAAFFPLATGGRARLDHLEGCLEIVRREAIAGDLIDCGTGRGGGAMLMRGFLAEHEMGGRLTWVADTFRADALGEDVAGEKLSDRLVEATLRGGDINTVRDGFASLGLLDDSVRFLQGEYATTLRGAPIERLALVRVGGVPPEAVTTILGHLYDLLSPGGFVIAEDYALPEVAAAVDAFREHHDPAGSLQRLDWSDVCWRRSAAAVPKAPAIAEPAAPRRPPLGARADGGEVELSVVVVFHDMKREAARTLHSLTRHYQQGIEDLNYEVVVVENGSSRSERLGRAFVESFGPHFRFVDLGREATSSPVHALNRGLAVARGENVAMMIDGAHMLTPGVLRFTMLGLRTHRPAIVAVQQWFLGPGQQMETLSAGYDRAHEDGLLDAVGWPADGYKLFEIGHFVGDRDWFDGMWESNCLVAPRELLEQAGCLDEAFSIRGGGYGNLDIFERVASAPGVAIVSILGEASFHQTHGGVTTNQSDPDEREVLLRGYARDYATLRGRDFRVPGKPIHYVGRFTTASRRTRARRMTAPEFWNGAQYAGPDGYPSAPLPMRDELRVEFVDAFWRTMSWRETRWGGCLVRRPPTDLLVYQELIERVRPDWVIETGVGAGGRGLFLASVCELFGHGRVLSIDDRAPRKLPQHPRLTSWRSEPLEPGVPERALAHVGEQARAMVIFGLASCDWLLEAFDAYEAAVPVGSYAVFEDTIVNGHPVWSGMGNGPMEAVREILRVRNDFVSDRTVERYALTFNPHGFLTRRRPSRGRELPTASKRTRGATPSERAQTRRGIETTMLPNECLDAIAGAEELEAQNRWREAIDLLTAANRAERHPEIEHRLVGLRHRAFEQLTPHPASPPMANGAAPPGLPPEIEAADLTSEVLANAVLGSGCLLVRGLLDQSQATHLVKVIERSFAAFDAARAGEPAGDAGWFEPFRPQLPYPPDIGRPWVREGGGVLAADSPAALFELLETLHSTGVPQVIGEYLGEDPVAISAKKTTLRRVPTDSGTAWHQDGAFLGSEIRAMNLWLALTRCGDDAPGLDILPRRLDDIVPTGTDGALFDWVAAPAMVQRAAGAVPILRPIFEPGDALLFDHMFMHRTGVSPGMTHERHAVEMWFFAPSRYPGGEPPLVI